MGVIDKDLGHGWEGLWGAYMGYNGSHQNYDRTSVYQNGGRTGISLAAGFSCSIGK